MYPDSPYDRIDTLAQALSTQRAHNDSLTCVLGVFKTYHDNKNFRLAIKVSGLLVNADAKIPAIQIVRELLGDIGLREAKLFCEWAATQ